jgi:hypothetical protein
VQRSDCLQRLVFHLIRRERNPVKRQPVVIAFALVVLFEPVLMKLSAVNFSQHAIGREQDHRAFPTLIERHNLVDAMDNAMPVKNRKLAPATNPVSTKTLHPAGLGETFGGRLVASQPQYFSDQMIASVRAPADSKIFGVEQTGAQTVFKCEFDSVACTNVITLTEIKSAEVAKHERWVGYEVAVQLGWR